jgi:hypothetical protein
MRKKSGTYREIHVCSFSSLDDLPKKLHGSKRHVLGILARKRRFSCFEASDSISLGRTITRLIRKGKIETTDLGYPWTGVELTNAGRAALQEQADD